MSNRPKKEDWLKYGSIRNSGFKGFNILTELPKLMSEEIDWMADFQLGFCSEADMPSWTSQGWVPLRKEHFEIEHFNAAVGLRFGLTDTDGIIRSDENVLMIMPKEYRKMLEDKRNQDFEEYYARTMSDQTYVVPEDPRRAEILETFADSTFEETLNVATEEPKREVEAKPKRGRPRKTKE